MGAVSEILLRVVLGLGTPVLFETDPQFGSFPRPNQKLHRFFVDFATNQYGMRSGAIAVHKSAGEYRILFVGDSVAFGTTYVNQGDILVEQIQAALGKGQPPVIAMNASSPGWAPSNELGFIRARGLLEADMVVMVYNTKDLTQSFAEYRQSPMTPLKNPHFALQELWSRYLSPRLFATLPMVDPGSTAPQGRPLPEDESRVLETIEKTRQFVVGHGARFVILYSPAYTNDVRQYQADWNRALVNLEKWAAEKAVPLLDMTELSANQPDGRLYFDGIHLRAAGDKLYADAFVKWFHDNETRAVVPGSGSVRSEMH